MMNAKRTRIYNSLTSRANQQPIVIDSVTRLEVCAAPIIVALCAYPMRWFCALARFFQGIQNESGSRPRFHQLIALFLFFPCFHVSDFFFKIAHTLNHRRLLRLSSECVRLRFQNGALKIYDFSLDLRHRLEVKKALCDVTGSLEAKNRTLYSHQVNHDFPSVYYPTMATAFSRSLLSTSSEHASGGHAQHSERSVITSPSATAPSVPVPEFALPPGRAKSLSPSDARKPPPSSF